MLIDTHCHLDFSDFNPDRDQVFQRAREAGINYFINIGATLESSAAACALAYKYPEVYASVGVHPHDANAFDFNSEVKLKQLAFQEKIQGILQHL